VDGQVMTAAQIIQRVSLEFSVDSRLLIALIEYRSGWLSNAEPPEERRIHPLGAGPSPTGFDRDGLYRQLAWAADQLNAGYYGWQYRELNAVEFEDGTRIGFAAGLNAGTIGLQYMLSQFNAYGIWSRDISADGFYHIYVSLFGDPFVSALDPLVPAGIQQPPLTLPFDQGEVWYYTGGPHGGWGVGSAWSAIDFAPPDDLTEVDSACYVSQTWATAVAPGVIARSGDGVVILDLDGDGREATGWTVLYLHMASDGRIEEGVVVEAGQRLGRPSCEGGFSNGTHMHIARRYNGEWIPADCRGCSPEQTKPSFKLGNWTVVTIPGQEYQGFLVNGAEERVAEQGRLTPVNLVSW
jgi:murein DD-endopeptidase MepM/ murein hydrolase activator NlpD